MRRIAFLGLLSLLAGCGGSDDTIGFRIAGLVLDVPGGTGVAGATVTCALDGHATTTDADGAYRLHCSVPTPADDTAPVAAVRFERPGFAPMLRALPVVDGAEYAGVVALARPAETRAVAIPTNNDPTTEEIENVTFLFLPTSLVDATGTAASGTVDVTLAAWDPSQPARPSDDPPFLDALLPPFPSYASTTAGDAPYLRPLAATYLDAGAWVPDAARGIDLTITSLYADVAFGGVESGDNRLFHQDPTTGVFVEAQPGRIDQRNQLTGGIDAAGTWVWAKEMPDATCIDVVVRVGDRACDGAQLRLFDVDVQDKDQTLLDDAIGSPGGTRCLHGPAGRLARLEVWLAEGGRLDSASVRTMTSAGGSCGACPRTIDVAFDCMDDGDCDDGSSCTEGECVPDETGTPDAIETGDPGTSA